MEIALTAVSALAVGQAAPAAVAASSTCPKAFLSSLNGSNCISQMTRIHGAPQNSVAACQAWCCSADPKSCQSWLYHKIPGGQCWTSSSAIDPTTCRAMNPGPSSQMFVGESTHPVPPPPAPRPPAKRKQGFSGAMINCSDPTALALADSWSYSWMTNQRKGPPCPGGGVAEFVPMINGIGQLDEGLSDHLKQEWASLNAHFLLGYNEPDYGNGHNHPHMCSPAEAARDWINVQKAAQVANLRLVSPAISTTGLNDNGESKWLDEFFANCSVIPGCNTSKIEFVAFHDYNGDPLRIIHRANGLQQRYGKQIWITEFAINKWSRLVNGKCNNCNITRAMQDAYMSQVLAALDQCDAVYRYAWYTARDEPMVNISNGNLLVWNNTVPTLESTGKIYRQHAINTTNMVLHS